MATAPVSEVEPNGDTTNRPLSFEQAPPVIVASVTATDECAVMVAVSQTVMSPVTVAGPRRLSRRDPLSCGSPTMVAVVASSVEDPAIEPPLQVSVLVETMDEPVSRPPAMSSVATLARTSLR